MSMLRRRIEEVIYRLIDVLDRIDGDPDLEPEPVEEQWDREADPAGLDILDKASIEFVMAEMSRRSGRLLH